MRQQRACPALRHEMKINTSSAKAWRETVRVADKPRSKTICTIALRERWLTYIRQLRILVKDSVQVRSSCFATVSSEGVAGGWLGPN